MYDLNKDVKQNITVLVYAQYMFIVEGKSEGDCGHLILAAYDSWKNVNVEYILYCFIMFYCLCIENNFIFSLGQGRYEYLIINFWRFPWNIDFIMELRMRSLCMSCVISSMLSRHEFNNFLAQKFYLFNAHVFSRANVYRKIIPSS